MMTQDTLAETSPPVSPAVGTRVVALDVLRGAVMAFMALDHTRDYFTNLAFDPEDLAHTWLSLFFTRWVTHFCAPLFFFLAGTGAYYFGSKRTKTELSRFLFTRGTWLMIVEFTIVGTAWTFKFPWGFFGVIWSLGISMIILSALVHLPLRWLGIVSGAVIVLHNLTDHFQPANAGWGAVWWLLHIKGSIQIAGLRAFVLFPVVPWFAVMAMGYCFGALYQRNDRLRWMLRIGWGMTIAFLFLRMTNLYGNPASVHGGVSPGDFHLQPTLAKTIILFLDTEKYPPSLQFLLMTLGPSLLLLSLLESMQHLRILRPLLVFGRVPFFFYVLHLYLIHAWAVVVALVTGQPSQWLLDGAFWFHPLPDGFGHGLLFVYMQWLFVLAVLYLPCSWFMTYKQNHHAGWLKYL